MRSVVAVLVLAATAQADPVRCVDTQFTPADHLQIVAWIEDAGGTFKDTVFITQQTGTFGLGNRPGRFDFNSGPLWPYGRRITTFPVWSHRNGFAFPSVLFQNDRAESPTLCATLSPSDPAYLSCGENQLSHSSDKSSSEAHYCRPRVPTEPSFDSLTCASPAFTDKGRFSLDPTMITGYPPRADLTPTPLDSSSVGLYAAMNPFDAVSQPTPIGGAPAHASWPVPAGYPDGDYVMFVEVSQERDFNATYNAMAYPSPAQIAYGDYGVPYRGQPSILYEVPFTISGGTTTASTMTFAGYGDPTGADGEIRPPDATITTGTPASGASRLELVADGDALYRVKVVVTQEAPIDVPGAPAQLRATAITSSDLTLAFVAPGMGAPVQRVAGYEIRVRANDAMTPDNFAAASLVTASVAPADPGSAQTFDVTGLLPITDYWIGVRAFDGCHHPGELAIVHVTTADRQAGTVDACFVATAAYGSIMANDVVALRAFRDRWLETNVLGELGVEAYYTFGPALAGVIGESDLLRAAARDLLAPIVRLVRHR
jgi:hypothetical protein